MNNLQMFKQKKIQVIFASFGILIILHLMILSTYILNHQNTLQTAGRNAAIQQVMNIIHMVQATPNNQLPNAIDSINIPHVEVSITNKPIYSLQIIDLTYWQINRLIPKNAQAIELSLTITNGMWVNVASFVNLASLWPQFLVLIIESILAIFFLFYAWSINRFIIPLKTFQEAADRLGLGIDTTTTVLEEFKGPKVIRKMAHAMNQMQQRIQDLLNDRTLMLAAISHDLRTPITRLKLRANLLNDEKLHKKIILDLDEMESMISEVLDFSENNYNNEVKSKIDLNSFLQTLCDELNDMGYPVNYHGMGKRLRYEASPLVLKRAISNLILNAVKYGKFANVFLFKNSPNINIIIEDQGPGIPEDELDKVFSPFYRCDQSRSRQIAGTGLGLAVAKDAVIAHHGKIFLENIEPTGLKVTITF